MSLLTVVQDVCAAVGVERPASVIAGINANRTMTEMLAVANEMAQRIAYDTREWRNLQNAMVCTGGAGAMITGDGKSNLFNLPQAYKRMLKAGNVWRSTSTLTPMRFIADVTEWFQRRATNQYDARGEWILLNNQIRIAPPMGDGITAYFVYLDRNCIFAAGGINQYDAFIQDSDVFRLDDRLLKLGMIWSWKQLKGSPYAEDMSNYETALAYMAGADAPAPIIIGRMPISAAINASYPFPIDPGMVPL